MVFLFRVAGLARSRSKKEGNKACIDGLFKNFALKIFFFYGGRKLVNLYKRMKEKWIQI